MALDEERKAFVSFSRAVEEERQMAEAGRAYLGGDGWGGGARGKEVERVGESSYRWQRALALCVSCRVVSCAVRGA